MQTAADGAHLYCQFSVQAKKSFTGTFQQSPVDLNLTNPHYLILAYGPAKPNGTMIKMKKKMNWTELNWIELTWKYRLDLKHVINLCSFLTLYIGQVSKHTETPMVSTTPVSLGMIMVARTDTSDYQKANSDYQKAHGEGGGEIRVLTLYTWLTLI